MMITVDITRGYVLKWEQLVILLIKTIISTCVYYLDQNTASPPNRTRLTKKADY